jgi:2,4-dienoyl-CoA reductase-like NADH-dependent reductase (Old Yellow Enzyme family)
MATLFDPLRVGNMKLENRIIMAPMTRSRANDDGIQPPFAAEYYGQRASAGLIITEATNISPMAKGYVRTPGIYTDEQIESWRTIPEAVHGFTKESGEALVEQGRADAIVYGTKLLANPDLPERFRRNAPLNEPDQSTFYVPGKHGYVDYPTLGELAATI